MKYGIIFCLLPLLAMAQMDVSLREAQKALFEQGLYFGEPDGKEGAETTAAIRRYQIRKGLDVTGQLNKETRESLAKDGARTESNTDSNTDSSVRVPPEIVEKDRAYLQSTPQPIVTATPQQPSMQIETRPRQEDTYYHMFRLSPYADAPDYVQKDTLQAAQAILKDWGYYRAKVDGLPGPATQRAIIEAQEDLGYRVTGVLDAPTLARMELLRVRSMAPRPHYLPRDGDYDSREPRVSGSISFGFGAWR